MAEVRFFITFLSLFLFYGSNTKFSVKNKLVNNSRLIYLTQLTHYLTTLTQILHQLYHLTFAM